MTHSHEWVFCFRAGIRGSWERFITKTIHKPLRPSPRRGCKPRKGRQKPTNNMKKAIFLSLLAIGSGIAITVTAPKQLDQALEYEIYERIESPVLALEAPTKAKQAVERPVQAPSANFVGNEYETRVSTAINQERAKAGLPSLTGDSRLNRAANLKLEDMLQKNYFAHRNPEGENHSHFMTQAGYVGSYTGENLARYYPVPESAVQGFMASPTHKANVLHPKYTDIGIAYSEKDHLLVVEFGSK